MEDLCSNPPRTQSSLLQQRLSSAPDNNGSFAYNKAHQAFPFKTVSVELFMLRRFPEKLFRFHWVSPIHERNCGWPNPSSKYGTKLLHPCGGWREEMGSVQCHTLFSSSLFHCSCIALSSPFHGPGAVPSSDSVLFQAAPVPQLLPRNAPSLSTQISKRGISQLECMRVSSCSVKIHAALLSNIRQDPSA